MVGKSVHNVSTLSRFFMAFLPLVVKREALSGAAFQLRQTLKRLLRSLSFNQCSDVNCAANLTNNSPIRPFPALPVSFSFSDNV